MLLRLNRKEDVLNLLEQAISANPRTQTCRHQSHCARVDGSQLCRRKNTSRNRIALAEWTESIWLMDYFWNGPAGLEKRGKDSRPQLRWAPGSSLGCAMAR